VKNPFFDHMPTVPELYGRRNMRLCRPAVESPLPPVPLRQRTSIEVALDRALSMRGLKLHAWAQRHGLNGSYVRRLVKGTEACGPRGRRVLELVRDELHVQVAR
jgi:hypothetical protein